MKKFLAMMLGFVVSASLLGFLLPGRWSAQRTVSITAPPEKILPYLDDLTAWPQWMVRGSVPSPLGDGVRGGPARGAGSTERWPEGKTSTLELVITASDVEEGVSYELRVAGGDARARGTFTMTPDREATRVTWVTSGKLGLNPVRRYVGVLVTSPAAAKAVVESLERLKTLIEEHPEEDAHR